MQSNTVTDSREGWSRKIYEAGRKSLQTTGQLENSVEFSTFFSENVNASQSLSREPLMLPKFRQDFAGDLKQPNRSSIKLANSYGHDGFEFENRLAMMREDAAVCPADILFKNGRLLPLSLPSYAATGYRSDIFSSSLPETSRAFNKSQISEKCFRKQGRSSSANSTQSNRSYWSSSGKDSVKTSCSSSGNSEDSRLNRTDLQTFQRKHSQDREQRLEGHPGNPAPRLAMTATLMQAEALAIRQEAIAANASLPGSSTRAAAPLSWKILSLQPLNPSHTRTDDLGQLRCSRGASPKRVLATDRGGSQRISSCERRSAMPIPRSRSSAAKEVRSGCYTTIYAGKAITTEQKQQKECDAGAIKSFARENHERKSETKPRPQAVAKKQSSSTKKWKPLTWLRYCRPHDEQQVAISTVQKDRKPGLRPAYSSSGRR